MTSSDAETDSKPIIIIIINPQKEETLLRCRSRPSSGHDRWNVVCGVRRCGVRSAECGVRNAECGVWSLVCEVWSVKWSVECGVWSVRCAV